MKNGSTPERFATGFATGVAAVGIRPYATTPFEYTYYDGVGRRRREPLDEMFLEGATSAWHGFQPDRASL